MVVQYISNKYINTKITRIKKKYTYIEDSPDGVQFYSMVVQQEDQEEWSSEQPGFHMQSPAEFLRHFQEKRTGRENTATHTCDITDA